MSGTPAAASNVGSQSRFETISLHSLPGLVTPGQRTSQGTRNAPSQLDPFRSEMASCRHRATNSCAVRCRCRRSRSWCPRSRVDRAGRAIRRPICRGRSSRRGIRIASDRTDRGSRVSGGYGGASSRSSPIRKRAFRADLAGDEVFCPGGDLVVDRLHPLWGQLSGVVDCLAAVRVRPCRRERRADRTACGSSEILLVG